VPRPGPAARTACAAPDPSRRRARRRTGRAARRGSSARARRCGSSPTSASARASGEGWRASRGVDDRRRRRTRSRRPPLAGTAADAPGRDRDPGAKPTTRGAGQPVSSTRRPRASRSIGNVVMSSGLRRRQVAELLDARRPMPGTSSRSSTAGTVVRRPPVDDLLAVTGPIPAARRAARPSRWQADLGPGIEAPATAAGAPPGRGAGRSPAARRPAVRRDSPPRGRRAASAPARARASATRAPFRRRAGAADRADDVDEHHRSGVGRSAWAAGVDAGER
jgi:hypothetical protein